MLKLGKESKMDLVDVVTEGADRTGLWEEVGWVEALSDI